MDNFQSCLNHLNIKINLLARDRKVQADLRNKTHLLENSTTHLGWARIRITQICRWHHPYGRKWRTFWWASWWNYLKSSLLEKKEMEKSLFSCFCNGTLRMYLISFGGILELFTPISYTGLGTLSYFPRSQPSKYHTVEIHLFPFLFILFLFYVGV